MWWIEQGIASIARVRPVSTWTRGLRGFAERNPGQSTVEYALVGALVVIAAAGALTMLGGELTTVFTNISHTLQTASTGH